MGANGHPLQSIQVYKVQYKPQQTSANISGAYSRPFEKDRAQSHITDKQRILIN